MDDIVQITGPGSLYAVDQGPSGLVYAMDTSQITPGTFLVSQPKPSTGDLPNDPGQGAVDLSTGVVTHIGVGLISPKGLLFVPAANTTSSGSASDIKTSASTASKTGLYGGIGVVVLVAVAGAFMLRRRRQT